MKKYVVHCVGEDDGFTTLCQPDLPRVRWNDETDERHMVTPASRVIHSRELKEFRNGRTYVPEHSKNLSMRFCQDCVNHPDLELIVLGEV